MHRRREWQPVIATGLACRGLVSYPWIEPLYPPEVR
jgi:hypothetical protein